MNATITRRIYLYRIFISGLFFFLSIHGSFEHPQCLDGGAPFDAKKSLSFCPSYSDYGCCAQKDDENLRNIYATLQSMAPVELWERCRSYAATFLCQKCSPYVAHLFEAEVNSQQPAVIPRIFPRLCKGYCATFYNSCREIVELYINHPLAATAIHKVELKKLLAAVRNGTDAFCEAVKTSDPGYCYPDVLDIAEVTVEPEKTGGCLCVEEIGKADLRQPVVFRTANDGSKRIFVGEQYGVVHIYYPNGTKLRQPFLDLRSKMIRFRKRRTEMGMLGLVFHPNFASNGKFYVYYSAARDRAIDNHKNVLAEFRMSEDNPNIADSNYFRPILEIRQPYSNHNGGEVNGIVLFFSLQSFSLTTTTSTSTATTITISSTK